MIGIFDSGLGGLSVLSAIAEALPEADLCYFADTAHVPYGDKSDDFIRERVLKIGHHLVAQGCSMIVVACNTATAAAVSALRAAQPAIPVIGVEPGVKPAATSSRKRRIAVLVTVSTARSTRLKDLVRLHAGDVEVDIVPCPDWATRVEKGHLDDPAFVDGVRKLLEPTLDRGSDRLVLGCTHYTFLTPILKPIVAGRAELIDVADAVARQCVRLAGNAGEGSRRLILSATALPERLHKLLERRTAFDGAELHAPDQVRAHVQVHRGEMVAAEVRPLAHGLLQGVHHIDVAAVAHHGRAFGGCQQVQRLGGGGAAAGRLVDTDPTAPETDTKAGTDGER